MTRLALVIDDNGDVAKRGRAVEVKTMKYLNRESIRNASIGDHLHLKTTTVAVVGLRGIPDVMGGIETHCEELLPRIKALRPDYDIVVFARSPYLREGTPYKGVEVQSLFTVKNKYIEALLHTFVAVLYVRFMMKCGLLHIHGIGPALLAPFARLLGLDVVITHHGEDFNRDKWNKFAKFFLHLGERCSVMFGNAVIVVSRAVAISLGDRHASERGKIRHIPNGATTFVRSAGSKDRQSCLDTLGLKPDGFVLAVGRLVSEKKFDVLIDAFHASGREGVLVIAGAADHEDAYAKALLARGAANVRFIGFQNHDCLNELYRSASLFVLASSHEGMPIAALEAAAAGCSVLLSDILPNVEIGLEARNYFPVGDVAALADKLTQPSSDFAIDSEALKKRFDWDQVAINTVAVYDAVSRTPQISAG